MSTSLDLFFFRCSFFSTIFWHRTFIHYPIQISRKSFFNRFPTNHFEPQLLRLQQIFSPTNIFSASIFRHSISSRKNYFNEKIGVKNAKLENKRKKMFLAKKYCWKLRVKNAKLENKWKLTEVYNADLMRTSSMCSLKRTLSNC